jgi:hypothetical protein
MRDAVEIPPRIKIRYAVALMLPPPGAEVALATANVSILRLSDQPRLMSKEFRTQFDSISIAIIAIDHSGSRLHLSKSTERLFIYSPKSSIG